MHDGLLRHTFSQSHRRTIDVNHLAKRVTPFIIVRVIRNEKEDKK